MWKKTNRRVFLAASLAMGGVRPPRLRGSTALPLTHSEPCMGTLFTVRAFHADEAQGYAAIAAAFRRMHALDAILSDYRSGNELDQLCQHGHEAPFAASADLFVVLRHALHVARETDGAFDVTLGPLTRLWREARKQRRVPAEAEREAARARTGWQGIVLDETRRTVLLPRAGMQLDFGGIAKGYAADAARKVLSEQDVTTALVAAGGDVAVLEPPPGKTAWRVALETGEHPQASLHLRERAVSTSGDLHQFVEMEGKRYSHILNPATGLGLTTRTAVSVVAPTATDCDSLSTALSVMGVEAARNLLATKPGIEARFVMLDGDTPAVWSTPGFPLG